MYNHHSNFWLIFQRCLLQVVSKVGKMVPNIVLGSIHGHFVLQFSYSIQIKSLQPSTKRVIVFITSKWWATWVRPLLLCELLWRLTPGGATYPQLYPDIMWGLRIELLTRFGTWQSSQYMSISLPISRSQVTSHIVIYYRIMIAIQRLFVIWKMVLFTCEYFIKYRPYPNTISEKVVWIIFIWNIFFSEIDLRKIEENRTKIRLSAFELYKSLILSKIFDKILICLVNMYNINPR